MARKPSMEPRELRREHHLIAHVDAFARAKAAFPSDGAVRDKPPRAIKIFPVCHPPRGASNPLGSPRRTLAAESASALHPTRARETYEGSKKDETTRSKPRAREKRRASGRLAAPPRPSEHPTLSPVAVTPEILWIGHPPFRASGRAFRRFCVS